jgi:hypothetical protein
LSSWASSSRGSSPRAHESGSDDRRDERCHRGRQGRRWQLTSGRRILRGGGVPAGSDRDGHEQRGAADRRRKLNRARRDGISAHTARAGPVRSLVEQFEPEVIFHVR